jgi:hypothetical protein
MERRHVGSQWPKGEIVKRYLSKVLMPDHPLYTEAVEALKLYHEAQAKGVVGAELERLRLMAEHHFQAVADYQLHAFGGPAEKGH